jgi:nucleoside-diphosphate-sugar epimerase
MRALVTGANGHVGNNLCRALLARGYEVRASVRSARETLWAADSNGSGSLWRALDLVELDVRDAARFTEVLSGIDVLFHAAAIYSTYTGHRAKDEEMVQVSLQGVENALRGAERQSVRKVVLTSSIVTLPCRPPGEPAVTEEDWRSDLRVPYFRAKTMAEQRAWELSKELGLWLVTVLPGTIGGPGFLRRTPTLDLFEGIMQGAMRLGAPNWKYPYVDIRDVVSGHILAAEKEVTGRFTLCNDSFPTILELTQMLHRIDATIPATTRTLPGALLGLLPWLDALNATLAGVRRTLSPELVTSFAGRAYNASNGRAARELGWRPEVPIETSLADMIAALRALRSREVAEKGATALARRVA